VSKAVVNKARARSKNKANVVYISSYKKRNIVKSYTKTDDDWLDIPRADDPTKTLAENSARVCGKVIYELHKNFDRPVYLTSQWFKKITKKKIHQNTTTINKNTHISKLDYKIQRKISNQLRSAGLFEEDIQLLMNGKLRDIEDNIDIVEVLV